MVYNTRNEPIIYLVRVNSDEFSETGRGQEICAFP